jgi:hypothetical protein
MTALPVPTQLAATGSRCGWLPVKILGHAECWFEFFARAMMSTKMMCVSSATLFLWHTSYPTSRVGGLRLDHLNDRWCLTRK